MATKPSIWETLKQTEGGPLQGWETLYRAKVPGGWLVRYAAFRGEGKSGSVMCHYPDRDHQWEGSEYGPWETCYSSGGPNSRQVTARLSVPGGWLVRDAYYVRWKHLSLDLVFIPDLDHSWILSDSQAD